MSPSADQLRGIVAPARERLVRAFDADLDAAGDLRSHCVAVSLYLRDALRAAGVADAVAVAGYFGVDDPDPETCACGSYAGSHDEACYAEPHAWVEAAGFLIDATASQFNDAGEQQFDELTIIPRAEALEYGPWLSAVSWPDDFWPAGAIHTLMGEWPASLPRPKE